MDKLEFDSLHKFFVSLGLVFIALPFAMLYFFVQREVTLISQTEFEALSFYSQSRLLQQDFLLGATFIIFPIIFASLLGAGITLLVIGIKNWKKVQDDQDALVAAERTRKDLETAQMKQSEVLERKTEEAKEAETITTMSEKSAVIKHMDIEDSYFFKVLPHEEKYRFFLKRNLRIGKYEYDGIAISKENNIDLIYEIKYWKQPDPSRIRKSLERLYQSGINYETVKHRNFRCILVIVTSKEKLGEMSYRVGVLSHENVNYDFSKIEIRYVAEDIL